jgi:hypothetical protein
MAKIIFVGIHNAPGKTPLDSSTYTGKVVESIAMGIGCEIIKTNLWDQTTHPEINRRTFGHHMGHVEDWIRRADYKPGDAIICLGDLVYGVFSYYRKAECPATESPKLIKLLHPSSFKARMHKTAYINEATEIIKNNI